MAHRDQARATDQPPSTYDPREGEPVGVTTAITEAGSINVWEIIPGTHLFSRDGEGAYERLSDRLFLRVDGVNYVYGAEVVRQYREALSSGAEEATTLDTSAEQEATELLARIDRDLAIEEALTQRLLLRYGLTG